RRRTEIKPIAPPKRQTRQSSPASPAHQAGQAGQQVPQEPQQFPPANHPYATRQSQYFPSQSGPAGPGWYQR
ncbi:hypothetical protein, partial [Corynebacterium variabile]|nr:hypothetical protein [Corynebacterium variabile]